MSDLPWLFKSGMRKVTVLGGMALIAELTACAALFTGHMPPAEWTTFTIQLIGFGGGLFVAGNSAEHFLKQPPK